MRARHAVVPALVGIALLGAGCGGGGADESATPTPRPITDTPQPGTSQQGANGSGVDTSTGGASDSGSGTGDDPAGGTAKDDIATQISKNPDLRTFSTALNAAGLGSILTSGTYTVFAPNNDAFTKLGSQLDVLLQPGSKAQLQNILKFHIVKGKYRTKKLHDGDLLTTLQGTRLRVTERGSDLLVGNSLGKTLIVTPDAKASNGVIHTVDTVLKPKTAS